MYYGQKAHSLRRFITLPTLTDERFMLALAIHPDEHRDLAALAANGWQLLDPREWPARPPIISGSSRAPGRSSVSQRAAT